jgi:uncharacterized protein (TIGR02284 family)
MSTHTAQVEKVSDVIQVMKAGIDFYQDAIEQVESNHVKQTFKKMVVNKKAAIDALQPLAVAEQGELETGSSIAVDSRKVYTKLAGMLSSNEDHTYVNQLEEVEDKVLKVLDSALEKEQPAIAQSTLMSIRTNAQRMHDEMKALQEQTKH